MNPSASSSVIQTIDQALHYLNVLEKKTFDEYFQNVSLNSNSTTTSQEMHQKLMEIDQLVNQIEQLFTEQNQLRYAINSSEIDAIESASELSKFIENKTKERESQKSQLSQQGMVAKVALDAFKNKLERSNLLDTTKAAPTTEQQ